MCWAASENRPDSLSFRRASRRTCARCRKTRGAAVVPSRRAAPRTPFRPRSRGAPRCAAAPVGGRSAPRTAARAPRRACARRGCPCAPRAPSPAGTRGCARPTRRGGAHLRGGSPRNLCRPPLRGTEAPATACASRRGLARSATRAARAPRGRCAGGGRAKWCARWRECRPGSRGTRAASHDAASTRRTIAWRGPARRRDAWNSQRLGRTGIASTRSVVHKRADAAALDRPCDDDRRGARGRGAPDAIIFARARSSRWS